MPQPRKKIKLRIRNLEYKMKMAAYAATIHPTEYGVMENERWVKIYSRQIEQLKKELERDLVAA